MRFCTITFFVGLSQRPATLQNSTRSELQNLIYLRQRTAMARANSDSLLSRDELYSRGVLDRDAKSPREDFRRVKNSLQARKLIGERNGVVWRAMS